MEYLFILGRNPELSIAELRSILGGFDYKKIGNAITIQIPILEKGFIDRLGGTIAIGQILEINDLDISYITSNKLNYVIWNFSEDSDFINEIREKLKERFKRERIKATEKKVADRLKLQSGQDST